MDALQRQRLVWLTPAGWLRLAAQAWSDDIAAACVAEWSAHDRPLVVARQRTPASPRLLVGLPAPTAWGRQRIALEVWPAEIARVGDFPAFAQVTPLLPPAWQPAARALGAALAATGAAARVYGSFGWQQLTGLAYLHADSDLDVLVRVHDAAAADAVVAALRTAEAAMKRSVARPATPSASPGLAEGAGASASESPAHAPGAPRLDGELVFDDGRAVAWREWAAWRAGKSRQVLVKTTLGASLASAAATVGGLAPVGELVPVGR